MERYAGIGLRQPHFAEFLETSPDIDWVEVHSENFFAKGGASLQILEKLRNNYEISLHGVGLSIGSADKISVSHLKQLKELVDQFKPFMISEHLSWSSINGVFLNDLLPIPYNDEVLLLISAKIDQIQQYLGREILIENPSTYLKFKESYIEEAVFLNNLAKKTKCSILLDVNNVYVSSVNNNFNALNYIEQIESRYIKEIHLAGHSISERGNVLIDTHDNFVCDDVWHLYELTIKKHGMKPTLLEWDADLPSLEELITEAKKSEIIFNNMNNILC
jgi:uncharacterized protein (UPF0276 family)